MVPASASVQSTPEAEEFVRFCYQRRRVGWPELYDEMCAVASSRALPGLGTERWRRSGSGSACSRRRAWRRS